jgi:hypothetical protein
MGLHEELVGGRKITCSLCLYLSQCDPEFRTMWNSELTLPVSVVSNVAVVKALAERKWPIDEASVRRHRKNHGR